MVHFGGGLIPLHLRMLFSTSPPYTTGNNSSDQQAANVPPATPLTSSDLYLLTIHFWQNTTLHSPLQNSPQAKGSCQSICVWLIQYSRDGVKPTYESLQTD